MLKKQKENSKNYTIKTMDKQGSQGLRRRQSNKRYGGTSNINTGGTVQMMMIGAPSFASIHIPSQHKTKTYGAVRREARKRRNIKARSKMNKK